MVEQSLLYFEAELREQVLPVAKEQISDVSAKAIKGHQRNRCAPASFFGAA
jgi:hypothetical protein